MIISVTAIKKPRTNRRCFSCDKAIEKETIRMYGAAHSGDLPFAIYLHPECVGSGYSKHEQKKVDNALASFTANDIKRGS